MAKQPIDYAKLSDELNDIVESIQSGDIDIDTALARYKRGMKITAQLEQYLKTAKNEVETVKKSFS